MIGKSSKGKALALFICILTCGCQNPYKKFYEGYQSAVELRNYEPIGGVIEVIRSNNTDRDHRKMIRKGYMLIGTSSFNAASNDVSEQAAVEHGKTIGAHAVILQTTYSHTASGGMPLTIPNTSTAYTTGNATAYGAGGMVNAYGSSTTTTYGSQTVMMPYSIDRSNFFAAYYAKTKSNVGLLLDNASTIDTETRRRIGTNAGVKIVEVVEGSPAFGADVLPGDVLLSVGDEPIYSSEQYHENGGVIEKNLGKVAVFKVWRDGGIIEKQIQILALQETKSNH
jgi:hypothetical protein